MKFKKVFIIIRNREHYIAVCNELERLGYKADALYGWDGVYNTPEVISTTSTGEYTDFHTTGVVRGLIASGHVQVHRTRHLRKILGHHTTSQDALSKLEVLPRSTTPSKSLSAPYGAYNDARVPNGTIVQTLSKYWQLGVRIVKAAVSKIVKHFK